MARWERGAVHDGDGGEPAAYGEAERDDLRRDEAHWWFARIRDQLAADRRDLGGASATGREHPGDAQASTGVGEQG